MVSPCAPVKLVLTLCFTKTEAILQTTAKRPGFNVNEINAFTFNNCRLPSLPFSVLLHRAKVGSGGSGASAVNVSDVPNAQSNGNNNISKPAAAGTGDDRSVPVQALRPNRQRSPSAGGRRRRQAMADQMLESEAGTRTRSQQSQRRAPSSAALNSNVEPKIKSLTINLNKVVDQRTLISVLTGLDQLEDLQLNYMQLNLTGFATGDMDAATTTTATTLPPEPITRTTANNQSSPTSDSDILGARSSSLFSTISAPVTGSSGVLQLVTTQPTTSTSSTSTTTTTTTTRPTTTTTAATSTTDAASTTEQPPSTNSLALKPSRRQQATTVQTSMATSATQPQQSIRAPTTTTTTIQSSSATQQQATPLQTITFSNGPSNFATARPPISFGAPRGLVVAQATGIPPTQLSSAPTSAPMPTTTSTIVTSSTTSTAPATPSMATSAGQTTTTTSAQNQVPGVSLAAAVASTRHLSSPQHTQQPSQAQSTSITTQSVGPGQRHQQQHPSQAPQLASLQTMTQPSSSISIGTSRSHSVSYTSNGAANTQPATATTSTSSSRTSSLGTSPNFPPSTSNLISASTNSASPNLSLSQVNRLHQTPSPWFATPPAAGSRMSQTSGLSLTNTDILIPSASSSNDAPSSVATPPSSFWSNQIGGQTHPSSSSSSTNSVSLSGGPNSGLTPPANVPQFSSNNPHSFGFRTHTSSNSFRTSSSSSSTPVNTQQSARNTSPLGNGLNQRPRQTLATTASDQPTSLDFSNSNNLVSAGGRLSTQSSGPARRHQTLANNQSPRQSSSIEDVESVASTIDSDEERHQRARRSVAASSGLEEFELSLGELLPNLRTLKLESFLDLSAAAATVGMNKHGQRDSTQSESGRRTPARHLNRFKRQFHANDSPEEDDGINDSSAVTATNADDTTLTDENSVHHNSVMASGSTSASSTASRQEPSPSREQNEHGAGSPPENSDMDQEPGEILWRAASDSGSIRISDADHDEDVNENPGPMRDADRANIAVLPAPPAAAMARSHATDSGSSSNGMERSASEQSMASVRHMSQVLIKLFSKLTKLRVLQLTGNDIPYWPDNVLHDSRHSLTRLYMISNNVRQLAPRSFAEMDELQIVDLSSNQLRQLDWNLFKDTTNLRHFRAARNLFRKIPLKLLFRQQQTGSSKTTNKLEGFDVSKNRYLTQLSKDQNEFVPLAVGSVAPLTSLNLSDCALNDQFIGGVNAWQQSQSMIANQFFASFPDVSGISLQNNKLRDFLAVANLFGKNSKLQRLDFSFNQLASLNEHLFNANASHLNELQLHHNHLREVPEQFLFNLRRLRHLSLAYNQLTQLGAKTFLTNQLIETIDLSHNQLITLNTQTSGMIPFGNGANLNYLNLAHNNLSNFESDLFDLAWSFYTNLVSLDLSHNEFSGQISMPIFYTIADELSLNLGSNRIQSISVDALVQHEQVLDRYATFESAREPDQARPSIVSGGQQQQHAKVPTVNIRLSNNPIACDCMLEPLISYTRRVAAATNPNLVASIFSANSTDHSNGRHLSSQGSRYALAGEHHQMSGQPSNGKQPQLLYQFRLNDLHCAQPSLLSRRLVSHISIGDLLCPILDERVCPQSCKCHYQSAFKTAIVDCNGLQLEQVPEQLTDATNFLQFDVQLFNGSSSESLRSRSSSGNNVNPNTSTTISKVDKVIIRLDNNRLSSMEQLAKLFTVVNTATGEPQHQRFARAPSSIVRSSQQQTSATVPTLMSSSEEHHSSGDSAFEDTIIEPASSHEQANGRRTVVSVIGNDMESSMAKKKISPAAIARGIQSSSSSSNNNKLLNQSVRTQTQRSRRQADASSNDDLSAASHSQDGNENFGPAATADSTSSNDLGGGAGNNNNQPLTTSVLESAEEFRNKQYPLTCELYLDHNSISELPESFLQQLDQVRASSMETSLTPPQAALPTNMLEPPVHTKLSNHHLMYNNDASANAASNSDPLRSSASNVISSSLPLMSSELPGASDDPPANSLFGRQVSPLAPEKKAALMETISENVERLNKQQQFSPGSKATITPSLVVLSLRYNNLGNINSRMLQRLSKLIKSSNTKLYFGHNPFNCSDNFFAQANSTTTDTSRMLDENQIGHPTSPMGDTLEASDSTSGAYLELTKDDLSTSASEESSLKQALSSSNCPVGQLKTWLTSHHANVGDLDELYCVHMSSALAEKLKLNATAQMQAFATGVASSPMASERSIRAVDIHGRSISREHDHPWTSSLNFAAASLGPNSNILSNGENSSLITKNGYTWNSEILISSAKLIDVDLYELCPYSGHQLASSSALVHQQVLMSLAILFLIISLCLLMMLIYFGDTQTILAFMYIHMNPIYNCMKLNESHLDNEKLYDAFVSYSSADRDIAMELIERLEQRQTYTANNLMDGLKPSSLDKSHDTLVTEAELKPDFVTAPDQANNNTLGKRRSSASLQDLNTMSRSNSRIAMNDSRNESALELTSRSDQALTQQQQQQKNQPPYRLCIHERDWLPGHLVSWNIVNSVQNSRRTILILSKDFIKSVWFMVEFHTAYYQMLEDKIDRLIVIVRGELPPKNELDKNLAFLLTTKTYLTWGEKWFWERLHYALPHRSSGTPHSFGVPHNSLTVQRAADKCKRQHNTDLKSGSLLRGLVNGPNNNSKENKQNNGLLMSNMGKDCSNLLPLVNNVPQSATSSASSSSSSSSSNASHATRSSASSFLEGSSANHPFGYDHGHENQIITTSNDLLSAKASPIKPNNNTTRLSIGGSSGIRTSSPIPLDSGRATSKTFSTSSKNSGPHQRLTSGVTSIMLGGSAAGSVDGIMTQAVGSNSRMRAKNQEKLQNFVDKEISNHFNLSEL